MSAIVGVEGNLVVLSFRTPNGEGKIACDPVSARKLAARINAMADVLDPERKMRHAEDMPTDPAGVKESE